MPRELRFYGISLALAWSSLAAGPLWASPLAGGWIDPSPHKEAFVTANGVRLQYLDWGGSGPALILIHGLGDNPHVFDDLALAFTDHFHVIAYARRGHGGSDAKDPYDTATLTEDLRGLMDALGLAKASLAGWSMGGTEATAMAVQYPERVERVVYLDSYDLTDPGYSEAVKASAPQSGDPPEGALKSLDAYLSYQRTANYASVKDWKSVEAYLRASIDIQADGRVNRSMPDSIRDALLSTMRHERRDYARVRCPVLAIFAQSVSDPLDPDAARRDAAIAWERQYWAPFRETSMQRLKQDIVGAQILTVAGSHEGFVFTSRSQVVDAMRRFLTAPALAGLDEYIEQVRADWNNMGLAIAIVQGTEPIYVKGFGVREVGKPAFIDRNTLFEVGSTTKAFTAAALGILVDAGKIHWDDPVIDYVPSFQLDDPWLTRQLTIRDVVSHRSGVVENIEFAIDVLDSQGALQQLEKNSKVRGRFRDSYCYSNLMYAVVGQVIERASGMSWHEFVQHRLLAPLKMQRSVTSPYDIWGNDSVAPTFLGSAARQTTDFSDARDPNVAMPHARDERGRIVSLPWQSYDNAAPAGAVISSAADMANWLIMNLNDGQFDGKQVLSAGTLSELHRTQNLRIDSPSFPMDEETYAMGWRKGAYRGYVHLAHGGGMLGFPAYVALLPERRVGIVVLSNGPQAAGDSYTLHKAIAFWVFDRLLGVPPRDWRQEFSRISGAVKQDHDRREEQLRHSQLLAPSSHAIEQYVGSYREQAEGMERVAVDLAGGRLELKFTGDGAFAAPLEHWHHDMFRLRPNPGVAGALGPQFLTFNLDPSGAVVSLTVFDRTFRRL